MFRGTALAFVRISCLYTALVSVQKNSLGICKDMYGFLVFIQPWYLFRGTTYLLHLHLSLFSFIFFRYCSCSGQGSGDSYSFVLCIYATMLFELLGFFPENFTVSSIAELRQVDFPYRHFIPLIALILIVSFL